MDKDYYSDSNKRTRGSSDRQKSGNRRGHYSQDYGASSRDRHHSESPRGNDRRNYVMTNAEKQARREKQLRAMRKKKARQRAMTYRLLFLCGVFAVVFFIWKAVTGITGYIDDSRQQAVDAMQNVEIDTVNESIDVAIETTAITIDTTTAAVETTEAYDPTKVLSNGRYVDTTKPMVALTWDDGPAGETGEKLMDILEQNNGRGTFFLVGNRISKFPDEVKRMAENGHEIANHSWDHDIHLSKNSSDYIAQEFAKTNNAVNELVGITPALVRLPGGNISDTVKKSITQPMIYWSIDTLDWKSKDATAVINTIQPYIKDGDIVLMHELYNSTVAACEVVIPWLAQQGYQLVTVSELIAFRNAEVVGGNGKQYSSFPYVPPETTAPETSAMASTASASSNTSESSAKASSKETSAEAKKSEKNSEKSSSENSSSKKSSSEKTTSETTAAETSAVSQESSNDSEAIEALNQEDDTYIPTSAAEAQKVSETAAWMAVGQNSAAAGDAQSDVIQAQEPN